jgi:hypothetical protein
LLHSSMEKMTTEKDFKDQLCFMVGGKQVCEKAFCNIIGMADPVKAFKNNVWVAEAKAFKERSITGLCSTAKSTRTSQNLAKDTQSSKLEHAYAYILQVAESMVMDKSAHANYDNHSYLPYHSGIVL